MKHRILFGVCGASGMPLAQAVLEAFAGIPGLETCLIPSPHAETALRAECGCGLRRLARLAARTYDPLDMAAGPASGSWRHDGMIICPCSMSSLAAIAGGCGVSLLHRAADATLKERRPLVLAARETPLSPVHLRNMLAAAEAGAIIMPFMPAFYQKPLTLKAMMRGFAGRLLDQLRIANALAPRWRDDG